MLEGRRSGVTRRMTRKDQQWRVNHPRKRSKEIRIKIIIPKTNQRMQKLLNHTGRRNKKKGSFARRIAKPSIQRIGKKHIKPHPTIKRETLYHPFQTQ